MIKAHKCLFSYNECMQQYFVECKLNIDDVIVLSEEIKYHLVKVLRKDSSYKFRVVDVHGKVFYAHLIDNNSCKIDEELNENNELDCDITCILSLIKNNKFELTIQKLVELGVKRIVPYQAFRSVIKVKDNKKLERIRKIVLEACEQSHRNLIPEVTQIVNLNDLDKYKSECNYICYESEKNIIDIHPRNSVSFIIGPEGGFDDKEYQSIKAMGFESISLGKRILRAETAAIYMTSVIVSKCQ